MRKVILYIFLTAVLLYAPASSPHYVIADSMTGKTPLNYVVRTHTNIDGTKIKMADKMVLIPNPLEKTGESRIDDSMSDEGIVTVELSNPSGSKIKVLITKDSKTYTYDFDWKRGIEFYPLQMGSGEYKVTVYENVSGTSYKTLFTKTLQVKIANLNEVFLKSLTPVKWDISPSAIAKASALTKGLTTDEKKAEAIYRYMVKNIRYDTVKAQNAEKLPHGYTPDIEATLLSGKGICYDFAATFAGMLRSVNIPARLVKGYCSAAPEYHAWNEVYLSGTWVVVDTTFDSSLTARGLKTTMVKDRKIYNDERFIY